MLSANYLSHIGVRLSIMILDRNLKILQNMDEHFKSARPLSA